MSFLSRKSLLALILLLTPLWQAIAMANDTPVIAAASDLSYALEKVIDRFARDTGRSLRVSFGSSGNLVRLIEQGAPFEMFMSADENYVFRLEQQGRTLDRGRVYAHGRLALFAPRGSALEQSLDWSSIPGLLADGSLSKFAIANPLHAPYGMAARETLQSLGLWREIEAVLVFGESASQATLFAVSGSTQGAIIPHSLALNPGISERGSYLLVDRQLHKPLRQRMVLLRNAGDTSRQFYRFMQGPVAQEIMQKYGFTVKGES